MLLDHGYLSCFSVSGPLNLLRLCVAETTLPFFVSSVGIDLPSDASPCTSFHESIGLLCSKAVPTQRPMGVARLPNISRSILGPVRILWSPTSQHVSIMYTHSLMISVTPETQKYMIAYALVTRL